MKNGNNSVLTTFDSKGNPDLTCIQVDDAVYSTINWTLKDSSCIYAENCGYLGIDDELLSEGLKLFPNPVSNKLKIESNYQLEKIEIYSILGGKLKEFNTNLESINVEGLGSGIYMIKLYSDKGSTFRKLIKE